MKLQKHSSYPQNNRTKCYFCFVCEIYATEDSYTEKMDKKMNKKRRISKQKNLSIIVRSTM